VAKSRCADVESQAKTIPGRWEKGRAEQRLHESRPVAEAACCHDVARTPQVTAAVMDLDNEIERLERLAAELEKTLDPVLGQVCKVPGELVAECNCVDLCQHAQSLRGLMQRVRTVGDIVEIVLGRVEL
jgi:hypothetical protein